MSFSSTPLGQGRRLDYNSFLNKPPSNGNGPSPPSSYSYGAPTVPPRSPRKSPSTNRDITTEDESALATFARQKREAAAAIHLPGAPKIISTHPNPDNWSVKDTSVIIASAFHTAAADMNRPNDAWASSSGPTRPRAPRSTSVEYETQVSAANANKRLAAPPPSRLTQRKPLSKVPSVQHVPDSEGEEDRPRPVPIRGKSPFEQIVDSAKRLGATASFYLQQKAASTTEPDEPPSKENNSSYSYEAEERQYQEAQSAPTQSASKRSNPTHKRNRTATSIDNKAYRPSASDEEVSDEDFEDEGKAKKGGSKNYAGLHSLPVISASKTRKRKPTKGAKGDPRESDDAGRVAGDEAVEQRSQSAQRASTTKEPPIRPGPASHGHEDPDTSLDIEQGLESIPEANEDEIPPPLSTTPEHQRRSVSRPPPSSQSRIGRPLGLLVNFTFRQFWKLTMLAITILTGILYFLGQLFGTLFDTILRRPYYWVSKAGPGALLRYVMLALILTGSWLYREPILSVIPTPSFPSMSGSGPVYTAPSAPAGDIAELAARLQRFENALSALAKDAEQAKLKAENEARAQMEYAGRLGTLENKVVVETRRMTEAEQRAREASKERIDGLRSDLEVLKEQWQVTNEQRSRSDEVVASDEEARMKVKSLEQRVESVEGGIKEALELGKKAAASTGSTGPSTAWWNKIVSGSNKLIIKSTDGQDITSLIHRLVDSIVTTRSYDYLARPDFALHSGGARVIPTLTSPTFEIRPKSTFGQLLGTITGNGYAIGHPPIMALHPENYNGRCWPFAGTKGQLGVVLASPTLIEDVTVDHVAKEVAYDMRSAPREMELWGMVEGEDNVVKVQEWMAERKRRREEAKDQGEIVEEEPVYPSTLPREPRYVRVASFTYDIESDRNVQTFPIDPEVKELGVDFGIVVLMVKSNWGRDEYTCLYRLRVHGRQLAPAALPRSEEEV